MELCMFENMSGAFEEKLQTEDMEEDGEGGQKGLVSKSVLTDGERGSLLSVSAHSDSTNLPKEQKQQRSTGQSPPRSTTSLDLSVTSEAIQ